MANTPLTNLPYPIGTDKVINGDNAIKALADALDGNATMGTAAAVTLGALVTGGGTCYRKPGFVIASVDFTIGAGGVAASFIVAGVPANYRPPGTFHFQLGTTVNPSVQHMFRVTAAGGIETVNALAAGLRIIGSPHWPR